MRNLRASKFLKRMGFPASPPDYRRASDRKTGRPSCTCVQMAAAPHGRAHITDQTAHQLVGAAGDSVVIYAVAKGDAGWLDGAFSAGDLMMVSTLSRS